MGAHVFSVLEVAGYGAALRNSFASELAGLGIIGYVEGTLYVHRGIRSHACLCTAAACSRHTMGKQEIYEHEALGGIPG